MSNLYGEINKIVDTFLE